MGRIFLVLELRNYSCSRSAKKLRSYHKSLDSLSKYMSTLPGKYAKGPVSYRHTQSPFSLHCQPLHQGLSLREILQNLHIIEPVEAIALGISTIALILSKIITAK